MNSANSTPDRPSLGQRVQLFWVRSFVALALVASLIWFAGLDNLLAAFASVNPLFVAACAIILCVFFLMGSINVWWLLRCKHYISYPKFLRSYSYGFSLGLLSPGQVGDATLVLFLRRGGVPIKLSGAAYALDKLISLSVMSLVTLFGLHRYELLGIQNLMTIVTMMILATAICAFLVSNYRIDNRFFNIIRSLIAAIADYRSHIGVVLGNVFLTALKLVLLSAAYFVAFRAFGTETSWPDIGVIPVMSALVGYIPISFGGIGTVELSAVVLFKIIGIGEAIVISTYLLLRSLQYALAMSLMGFVRNDATE